MHAADHHFFDTSADAFREGHVHRHEKRLGAAEAEQLAARNPLVETALESFGALEQPQNRNAWPIARRNGIAGLCVPLQPTAAVQVVDMPNVPADGTRVCALQPFDQRRRTACIQSMQRRLQLGYVRQWSKPQWIEFGAQIAACAISLGQPCFTGPIRPRVSRSQLGCRLLITAAEKGLQRTRIADASECAIIWWRGFDCQVRCAVRLAQVLVHRRSPKFGPRTWFTWYGDAVGLASYGPDAP